MSNNAIPNDSMPNDFMQNHARSSDTALNDTIIVIEYECLKTLEMKLVINQCVIKFESIKIIYKIDY